MKKALGMMGLALGLCACQSASDPGFYDNLWRLDASQVKGPLATAARSVKGITLKLSSDGRLSGEGGCNRYFADYQLVNGAAMTVGHIGSTKMACMGELMQAEGLYLDRLQKANWLERDGANLKLFSDGFESPLVFVPSP
ncbi:MAG: META domain-containing protein [Pseudomonadota bacterium]|uniref:META domain-containing protein n=1 Tax=Gallaecimonas pentaromativorans TaxID=584787 RepID=UPI0009FB4445|nr:META domain-containing protein [Gallaecimonas pentaromativorans]MED5525548.1 META domain-containing protein [Pseudomonadota bacterium]